MRNRNFVVGGGSLCVLNIVGYQSGFSWEGEVNYVRGMTIRPFRDAMFTVPHPIVSLWTLGAVKV